MDDSDRNIMASLQHEACDVCVFCDKHICPQPVGSNPYGELEFECYADDDREQPCHQDCFDDAYQDYLEQRAEARAERRLSPWQ